MEHRPVQDADRLASIVEHMSDAFLVIDREWRFTYFNDRALDTIRVGRQPALGRKVFEVYPELVGTDWERQCRRAMEERVPVEFEVFFEPDDTWSQVRVYPWTDGIALYYRDVTERKRGDAELKRRAMAIDGINRIIRTAWASTSESTLAQVCLEVAEEVTESRFGFISELCDDGLLHDIAISNPGWKACATIEEPHRRLREPGRVTGLHGKVVREGRSFYTNDPASHPERMGLPPGHPPLTSFLGVPLKEGGKTLGLIGLANRPGGYDDELSELVELVAPATVEAFQRLRSQHRERRRAQYDRALNEVSTLAHSSLDGDTILESAVQEVARVSGLNAVAVHVRGEEGWSFTYSYGLPEELGALRLSDEQAPMSLGVMTSGERLVMADTFTDPRANKPFVTRFDIRSLIGLPLVVRGEPFGVFFAGSVGKTVRITDAEADFLQQVSWVLSLALQNARLYEAEHRIAETLQQALLSLPNDVGGISFAHAYKSAAEAARVGGDFFDIFEVENNRIAVVIGDVAGKGLEAAALTSLLRSAIRAHAAEPGLSVADVMRMTSDLVYKVTSSEMYATVFLAFVECSTGHMTYSNAGHPSAVSLDHAGNVRPFPGNSPLVGAFESAEFHWDEATLGSDDMLLLYTDGVIEARSHGQMYGEPRLFQLASETKDGDPAKVVRAIVDDLLEYVGGVLTDDAAIMAVKLSASAAAFPPNQEIPMP